MKKFLLTVGLVILATFSFVKAEASIGVSACNIGGRITEIYKENSSFSFVIISTNPTTDCPIKTGEEYKATVSDLADVFYLSLQKSMKKDNEIKTSIEGFSTMTPNGEVGHGWAWSDRMTFYLAPTPVMVTIEPAPKKNTSIKDFINLLITIGVIEQDKIAAVNAYLLTLDSSF